MVFVGLPVNRPDELSEKKNWGLGFCRWFYYPQFCGALYYSYIKQPVFHGKVRDPLFFLWRKMLGCVLPGNTGGASRWRPWEVPNVGSSRGGFRSPWWKKVPFRVETSSFWLGDTRKHMTCYILHTTRLYILDIYPILLSQWPTFNFFGDYMFSRKNKRLD